MVHVRSVAFVQLYFCFKQAVFNLVFSYIFIDLGTEDPKSQQVRWWKSWHIASRRHNNTPFSLGRSKLSFQYAPSLGIYTNIILIKSNILILTLYVSGLPVNLATWDFSTFIIKLTPFDTARTVFGVFTQIEDQRMAWLFNDTCSCLPWRLFNRLVWLPGFPPSDLLGFWVFRFKVYKHVRKHQVKYSLFKTEI